MVQRIFFPNAPSGAIGAAQRAQIGMGYGGIAIAAPVVPSVSEPTWGTAFVAIFEHWNAQFPVSCPGVNWAWDNVPFSPPSETTYAAIRVEPYETKQASVSASPQRWRTTGAVVVDIFAPSGDGIATAFQMAGDVVNIWRGLRLINGRLVFRRSETQRVGINEQQQYQLIVRSEFFYDALV